MQRELKSKEEFEKLLDAATELRVIRTADSVKVKLRTRDTLYTLKTTPEEADSLVKGAKVPVEEI